MVLKVTDIRKVNPQVVVNIPLIENQISAGFPSPADDYIEKRVSLDSDLLLHPSSTFLLKVEGESMIDAGIFDGDIVVVDKSIQPENGDIVIAALDGELTVKKIKKQSGRLFLLPENKNYPSIEINEANDLRIWGVVLYSIKKHNRKCTL